MAQQVNLCLPILRKQPKRFGAQSLALALAVILVLGAALAAAWVWNLNKASDSLQATLAAQSIEMDSLRAALERAQASANPGESAVQQELRQRRLELQQRQSILEALSQGLFEPGRGHSARLQLVAQTIPPVAWLTHIRTDDQLLELGGYTLEPAALNDWVGKLAISPLLQGQSLTTAKVEGVKPPTSLVPGSPGVAQPAAVKVVAGSVAAPTSMWSFSLLSKVAAAASAKTGGQP
ncbi:PilN domain-containing protein [Rhodoferax antarcticus]|uniref:PilN domain-containing protein n=1 Tax=Rhodoferax antarcticus TaxID=81479 RepID=UPI00222557B2|nr:PilN domain-containing protein [Rhodoferax antarcticus]MCW2313527.1 Tfp pilus assembly protein PilN [Rhodoferax antarcticus]